MTTFSPELPAHLDPVIKEAKRRARRRRLLIATALLVVGVSAATFALRASAGPASPRPSTLAQLHESLPASASTGCTTGPRPAIGKFPGDKNSDGKISDSGNERIPALVAAVGDHGVAGYVRVNDVFCTPAPASPAAALAEQEQGQVIPVYAANGTTVVDTLTIRPPSPAPTP
jgi:hypothetical protein